jgi:putative membrane protein
MEPANMLALIQAVNSFFLHFVSALMLTALFSTVYIWITPYPGFNLIKDGKYAPAVSFSGALLGFVIPLSSAICVSTSYISMLFWALFAMSAQIGVFILLRNSFPKLCRDISEDLSAPAILLASASLASGLLIAACLSY